MRKAILIFLLSLLAIPALVIPAYIDTNGLYPMTAVITSVDTETDIVTMETATGHIYEFYGCEDYEVSDLVSCIMNDNRTENVSDDIIIDVRYSGFNN